MSANINRSDLRAIQTAPQRIVNGMVDTVVSKAGKAARFLIIGAVLSGCVSESGPFNSGNNDDRDDNLVNALDRVIEEAEEKDLDTEHAVRAYEDALEEAEDDDLVGAISDTIDSLERLVDVATVAGYDLSDLESLEDIAGYSREGRRYEHLMEFLDGFETVLRAGLEEEEDEDDSDDDSTPEREGSGDDEQGGDEVTRRPGSEDDEQGGDEVTWPGVAVEGIELGRDVLAYLPNRVEEVVVWGTDRVTDWVNMTPEERRRSIINMSATHGRVEELCRTHIEDALYGRGAQAEGADPNRSQNHLDSLVTLCAAVNAPAECATSSQSANGDCNEYAENQMFDNLPIADYVPEPGDEATEGGRSTFVNPFAENGDEPSTAAPTAETRYDNIIRSYCEREVTPWVMGQNNDMASRFATLVAGIPAVGDELARRAGIEEGLLSPHPELDSSELRMARLYANEVCFEELRGEPSNMPGHFESRIKAEAECSQIVNRFLNAPVVNGTVRSFYGVHPDEVGAAKDAAREAMIDNCTEVVYHSSTDGTVDAPECTLPGSNVEIDTSNDRATTHFRRIWNERISDIVHPLFVDMDLSGCADSFAQWGFTIMGAAEEIAAGRGTTYGISD